MEIRVPQLAEGSDLATVVNVLVKEGDRVEKEQSILELETSKAVGAVPSPAAGVVSKIYVKPGQEVKVGQKLLSLEGEENGGSGAAPASKPTTTAAASTESAPPSAPHARPAFGGGTSPTMRRMARELAAPVDFSRWGPVTRKPMSPLRKTIAARMSDAWTAIPHVTQFEEVDVTDLMPLIKKHAAARNAPARLTISSFAMKAAVAALKEVPLLNSSLDEAANEIVFKNYYHLGIAVDTEHGLIVPVVRDVDKKTLVEISEEVEKLAEKTRSRKVTSEELQGGTFTISNLGGIGGGAFTPIVYKPQVAILGIGRGVLKPVVRGKKVVARMMLPIALSYDHRVVDGAEGARFLVSLVRGFSEFGEKDLKAGKKV